MTAYGMRLYKLSAHNARSTKDLPLNDLTDCGVQGDACLALHVSLKAIEGQLFVGKPAYLGNALQTSSVPAASQSPSVSAVPYLRVIKVSRSRRRVDVVVEYGREGDYESVISSATKQSEPMDGKATARTYRVMFLVPLNGSSLYMACETKGRTQGGEALVHTLKVSNQHEAFNALDAGQDEASQWLRWGCKAIFDPGRIQTIMRDSEKHAIKLKRKGHGPSGTPHDGDVILTEQGIPLGNVASVVNLIKQWWDNRNTGTPESRSKAAADELGSLVSVDVRGIDFTDGEIVFQENGKTQTVTPNTIERLFVYPIGETAPSDDELRQLAAAKLSGIEPRLNITRDLNL